MVVSCKNHMIRMKTLCGRCEYQSLVFKCPEGMAELIMNFRKKMEMSGHALAALSSGREPPVPMEQEAEWTPRSVWNTLEKRRRSLSAHSSHCAIYASPCVRHCCVMFYLLRNFLLVWHSALWFVCIAWFKTADIRILTEGSGLW